MARTNNQNASVVSLLFREQELATVTTFTPDAYPAALICSGDGNISYIPSGSTAAVTVAGIAGMQILIEVKEITAVAGTWHWMR